MGTAVQQTGARRSRPPSCPCPPRLCGSGLRREDGWPVGAVSVTVPATVAKVFVANSQCLNKSLLETCLERQGSARFTAIFQSPYSRVDLCPDAEAAAAEATGWARVTRSLGRGRRRHASPPPVHISDAGGAWSPTKPTANEALLLSGTAPAPCPGSHCPLTSALCGASSFAIVAALPRRFGPSKPGPPLTCLRDNWRLCPLMRN